MQTVRLDTACWKMYCGRGQSKIPNKWISTRENWLYNGFKRTPGIRERSREAPGGPWGGVVVVIWLNSRVRKWRFCSVHRIYTRWFPINFRLINIRDRFYFFVLFFWIDLNNFDDDGVFFCNPIIITVYIIRTFLHFSFETFCPYLLTCYQTHLNNKPKSIICSEKLNWFVFDYYLKLTNSR